MISLAFVGPARQIELGAPPEELYGSFDPKPLAAASLGQVHRATLLDGRPVAVKVQRPNIESRVKADLQILQAELYADLQRHNRILPRNTIKAQGRNAWKWGLGWGT